MSAYSVSHPEASRLSSNKPFKYQPLDPNKQEIRLLRLHKPPKSRAWEKQIECRIFTTSICGCQPYKALSYAWESENGVESISINQCQCVVTKNLHSALLQLQKTLPVDDDCIRSSQALESWSVPIWIDAVCINQQDKAEKSSQVAQMDEVYKNAAQVLVWLGPANGDSALAMQEFDSVGGNALQKGLTSIGYWPNWAADRIRESRSKKGPGVNPGRTPLEQYFWHFIHSILLEHNVSDKVLTALNVLMIRSWWKRMWVIQEVTLAKDVRFLCGPAEVAGEHVEAGLLFYSAAVTIQSIWMTGRMGEMAEALTRGFLDDEVVTTEMGYGEPTIGNYLARGLIGLTRQVFPKQNRGTPALKYQMAQNLQTVSARLKGGFRQTGLTIRRIYTFKEHLASEFRLGSLLLSVASEEDRYEATNPRDIVYALLGITRDTIGISLIPNYEKSVEDVFIETAKYCIRDGQLDLLALCQEPRNYELPSWVPDWTVPLRKTMADIMRTSSTADVHFYYGLDGKHYLSLLGTKLAEGLSIVDSCEGDDPELADVEKYLQQVHQQVEEAMRTQDAIIPATPRKHAIARLLLRSVKWAAAGTLSAGTDYAIELKDLDFGDDDPEWNADISCTHGSNMMHYLVTILSNEVFDEMEAFQAEIERSGPRILPNFIADIIAGQAPNSILSIGRDLLAFYMDVPKLAAFVKDAPRVANRSISGITNFEVLYKKTMCRQAALKLAKASLHRRKLFVSKEGTIGICPEQAQPGDLVAQFKGSVPPYVLRRIDNECYRLIGEAVLDPVQWNDAMSQGNASGPRWDRFFLC